MKKIAQNFNAISALTDISRKLEGSKAEIIGLYSKDLKRIQKKNDQKKKDKQLNLDLGNTKSELDDEVQQLQEKIQQLSTFLSTTPLETLVFVSIYSVQTMRSCNVDCRDMARFLDINNMDFLPLKVQVTSLLEKGLIRVTSRHRENDYIVSSSIEHSLLENKPFKVKKIKKIDRYQFCAAISSFIDDRSEDNIDTEELINLVQREEDRQEHLSFVKDLKKLLPNIEDRIFFYEMCDDHIHDRYHRNTGIECTLNDIYDDMRPKMKMARSIMNKENAMFTTELASLQPAQFIGDAEITLSEKGKKLIMEEDYEIFHKKGGSDSRLITPDKIPARELFFNEELTQDLDFVQQSLQEDSFVALQKRLEDNSLAKGVSILFHGLPGTGKTAAVDMIAKATGRSVYHVDIAASKTCWFGESEKLFKKIFTDYKRMCETEPLKPILLFNEADALFSKRRDVDTAGNCAQTENALQNILLEEMEKLDGILIATTNLSDNFDDAFERRFLFKIRFGKPTTDAKKSIWKSKLPWLTDEDCRKLAAQHDLSGGEIDNIVRKALMEEVLKGNRPDIATLGKWCSNEKLNNGKGNSIGFSH